MCLLLFLLNFAQELRFCCLARNINTEGVGGGGRVLEGNAKGLFVCPLCGGGGKEGLKVLANNVMRIYRK